MLENTHLKCKSRVKMYTNHQNQFNLKKSNVNLQYHKLEQISLKSFKGTLINTYQLVLSNDYETFNKKVMFTELIHWIVSLHN